MYNGVFSVTNKAFLLQASDFTDICDWPTLGDPPHEVSFLFIFPGSLPVKSYFYV